MRPTDPVVTLHGRRLKETEKAVLFRVDHIGPSIVEGNEPLNISEWFPLSQISKIFRQKLGSPEPDYMIVSEWIVKQKEKLAAIYDHLEEQAAQEQLDEGESPPDTRDVWGED